MFQSSSEVFACKTTTFEWKQRAYIQNDACLLFPNFICGFAHSQEDFSIRITSLYGSQLSFAAFSCKTATLGPELQVSKGPRTHLWFFCIQNREFSTRIASPYGSQPSSVVFACKTATSGPEFQVSIGPSPHLRFLHAKQRLLNENSVLISRMMLVYCSQTSSVVLRIHNRTLASELLVSMDPSPHLRLLHAKQRL